MPEVAAEPASEITRKILILRGQRVLLDSDQATLHQTTTKALNQAAHRNGNRFPADFMFRLTSADWESLRSQLPVLKTGLHSARTNIAARPSLNTSARSGQRPRDESASTAE